MAAELRESLVFDFGVSLMSRNAMWLIGIDYLEHSSSEGKTHFTEQNGRTTLNDLQLPGIGAIEVLLPRIPVTNERQAIKVISVAKTKGFPGVGKYYVKLNVHVYRYL